MKYLRHSKVKIYELALLRSGSEIDSTEDVGTARPFPMIFKNYVPARSQLFKIFGFRFPPVPDFLKNFGSRFPRERSREGARLLSSRSRRSLIWVLKSF